MVSKSEVAAALLRGLTADEPEGSDPILDLVYDMNMFEMAWRGLQQDDGVAEGGMKWDRWGLGASREWEGRIRFEAAFFDECSPSDNPDPSEEYGSVVASDSRDGMIQAFHEVLKTAGQSPETFDTVQRELHSAAEACPRALVCREAPCPGLAASHARFSPEVGDFGESCAVTLHVFDQGFWPWGNHQSTAMLIATAPDLTVHERLPPRAYLCAIRAIGSNITRAVREYNRLASAKPAPTDAERTSWFHTDMRAQVESFLSDINLWSDKEFQSRVAANPEGWVDMDFMKGLRQEKGGEELVDAELLDILGASKYVETKVGDDGHVLVRRPDVQEAFQAWQSATKKWNQGDADDPRCWDFVRRGFCRRGESCRYAHTTDMDEAKAAMEKREDEMVAADPGPDRVEQRGGFLQNNSDLMMKLCQAAGLLGESGEAEGVSDPQFLSLAYGMQQYNAAEERQQLRSLSNARVVAPPPKAGGDFHGKGGDSVVLKPWASSGWSDMRGMVKPPKPPKTAAEAAAAAAVTPGPAPANRVQAPPAPPAPSHAGQGIHVPPPPHAAGAPGAKTVHTPPAVNPPPPPPAPDKSQAQAQAAKSQSAGRPGSDASTKRPEASSTKRPAAESTKQSTKPAEKAKEVQPATEEDKAFMERMLKRRRRFEGW